MITSIRLMNTSINLRNKIHILWQDKKNLKVKNDPFPLISSLLPYWALCAYITHQLKLAINRNTCSTIKSSILPAPTRQLLKR